MTRLSRHSERFAASGGIGARTTRRALGAHTLGFWELFIRETLQNSWDARRSADGPITFSVDAWTATPAQRTYLRDFVLTEPPPLLGLEPALDGPDLDFLVVSDGGTHGLSGPTRADVDPKTVPGGRSDFVDFVRDTGRRADKGYAGGTYGFGKVVLCEASAVSTIVIYTRTMMSGLDGSRLIAMAVGNNEYSEFGFRYTGRHWWGNVHGQLAEPLLGPDADTAAFRLGMHNLIRGLTGTAILVVAPRSPGAPADDNLNENLRQITMGIAHAAAEYAWPHMLPGRASIDLKVTCRGEAVPVATPTTDARLKTFAEAFARCQRLAQGTLESGDGWPWHDRVLKSERPQKLLGTLAWRQTAAPSPPSAVAEPRSQVALIRNPHFVVTYREAPTDPSGRETFGVFLAAPDLDDKYAGSEPPTHDAWIPAKGTHFDPARRVLKQITEEIRERPKVDQTHGAGGDEPGVVSIASTLGILLDGQTAIGDPRILLEPSDPTRADREERTGAGQTPRYSQQVPAHGDGPPPAQPSPKPSDSGQGTTQTPQGFPDPNYWPGTSAHDEPEDDLPRVVRAYLPAPTTHLTGEPKLCMYGSTVAAEFPFTLRRTKNLNTITIFASPSVFIDGGKENEPPIGAAIPRILAWRDLSTGHTVPGQRLELTQPMPIHWSVLVSQLPDAAVGVDVLVERYK